jgi:hypothetical protein
MHDESPKPISAVEERARLARVAAVARRLGFVGIVEYRHVSTPSGGAQYGMGAAVEQDLLVVYPEAFRRDAAPDDFSLEAIIAHERGHQLICRDDRLRRNLPNDMSSVTEEVLASLVGSVIVGDTADADNLVLKALFLLSERGMPTDEASRRVQNVLTYLEGVL